MKEEIPPEELKKLNDLDKKHKARNKRLWQGKKPNLNADGIEKLEKFF